VKNIVLSILLLVVFASAGRVARADSGSTTVQFTVPPGQIGIPFSGGELFQFFSSALNGTSVDGQTLSVNAVFSNSVLARIYPITGNTMNVDIVVFTNGGTFTGFPGPGTGFLLGPTGNQVGSVQALRRSAGDVPPLGNGFGVGFVNPSGSIVDISGANFDFEFPNDGFVVTDVEFILSEGGRLEFGTAQQLPEPSTLPLTLMGLLPLIGFAVWRRGI
jgi:hypothetical protein